MILVQRRVWRTTAGVLVPDGHPDAAFLAYAPGTTVPDLVAARVGLTADLAADPARTVEVPPASRVPAAGANLSGTTVVPDPTANTPPVTPAVVVADTSVDGAAVVAPARIIENKPTRTARKS